MCACLLIICQLVRAYPKKCNLISGSDKRINRDKRNPGVKLTAMDNGLDFLLRVVVLELVALSFQDFQRVVQNGGFVSVHRGRVSIIEN